MKRYLVSASIAAAFGVIWASPSVYAAPLNFNPVDPCRILDTRELATPAKVEQNTVIDFSTNDADFTSQGGNASGCGLPDEATGDAVAVAITITTTQQDGVGHIQVFPYDPLADYTTQSGLDAALPNASVLNFGSVDIANTTSVTQLVNAVETSELGIYVSQGTHLIVDVAGYYTEDTTP